MEKRTKLVDKNIYVKWYNIARDEINNSDLVPERSQKEIFELVSNGNWLMFGLKGQDKETAIINPEPNVFLDILSKEGDLTGFANLGLTFNNIGAYNKFKSIMKGQNKIQKEKITNELTSLKYPWNIVISKKIKKYNPAQTPEYFIEKEWNCKDISPQIIDEIIITADKILEQGKVNREKIRAENKSSKKFYTETPSINIMEFEFKLNEEEFRDRISEIFKVLSICLSIKSNVEVNMILRKQSKLLIQKKEELEILTEEIPKYKNLIGVLPQFTQESLKEKEEQRDILEKEVNNLEEEINN